jgi:hypothetical protein
MGRTIKCWLIGLKVRDHWEDLDIRGRVILKFILMKRSVGVDKIYVSQDWDLWWNLVNSH